MIAAGDFKKGSKVLFRGEPYVVQDFQHVKPGKGGAFVRTKMKNLISGLVREETFRSGEKLETPDLAYRTLQYLYVDDGMYHFMDQDSFDTVTFHTKQIEDVQSLLKEQEQYTILYFDNKPIEITPPLFMELVVTDTVPGVRGDTAQGSVTKPATLETGLKLQVPLFVNEGDTVKIDTRDRSYIERILKK